VINAQDVTAVRARLNDTLPAASAAPLFCTRRIAEDLLC
jgi:hypothetical protein